MSHVLIVGATGGVGRHTVRHALAMGHTVRALARTPTKLALSHPNLTVIQGDVRDAEGLASAMEGIDMVLSCLGTPRQPLGGFPEGCRNLCRAMTRHAVERLALISSIGVGDSLDQSAKVSWVFRYMIMPTVLRTAFVDLNQAEAETRAHHPEAIFVRPTGLRDHAGTGRFLASHATERDPRKLTTFISRDDVGLFMAGLIDDTRYDGTAVSLFAG